MFTHAKVHLDGEDMGKHEIDQIALDNALFPDEIAQLKAGFTLRGGGGAAPPYSIIPVPSPEEEAR